MSKLVEVTRLKLVCRTHSCDLEQSGGTDFLYPTGRPSSGWVKDKEGCWSIDTSEYYCPQEEEEVDCEACMVAEGIEFEGTMGAFN